MSEEVTEQFVETVLRSNYIYQLYYETAIPIINPMSRYQVRKKTRLLLKQITSACKYWQLFCAILFTLFTSNPHLFTITNRVYSGGVTASNLDTELSEQLKNRIHSLFKDVFYGNGSRMYNLVQLNRVESDCNNETRVCPVKATGVYNLPIGPSYFGVCLDGNTVSHYFTIYNTGKEKVYLSSSYKSEFITSPAKIHEIRLGEFKTFLNAINNTNNNNNNNRSRQITAFYKTYFFHDISAILTSTFNGQRDEYPIYNEKGYFKKIYVHNPMELELNYALFHKINTSTPAPELGVFEFTGYQTEIDILNAASNQPTKGGKRMARKKTTKRRIRWGRNTYRKIPSLK